MPIRLNLLAEAQAAEDLRRRDPVKRAVLGGVLLVVAALVWSSSLQLKAMLASRDLDQLQAAVDGHTNAYQRVLADEKQIAQTKDDLKALQTLTADRFLQGNLLDALQHIHVQGVALTRLRVDQSYVRIPGKPAHTVNGRKLPGTPTKITEHTVVMLQARDAGPSPGDDVNKFKLAIEAQPYFRASLAKTNAVRLVTLSAPEIGPDGRPYVSFTLECHYPDYTR